ncbi:NAD-dependent epimerase/dehydratase family protein [Streptomyces sioyaensis]|uniref:NAD-dependent epimerase/dehydratase family protein n=1 Tax=Streptomyces sioyaensis TaxID=67364 RepID=UPI0037D92E61
MESSALKHSKVVITGASGNLGSGLAARLADAGIHQTLCDRTPPATDILDLPDVDFIACDLENPDDLRDMLQRHDILVHLAAHHGATKPKRSGEELWKLNVDGLFKTLQCAMDAGIRKLVYLSSMARHDPRSMYGLSKRIGEDLCQHLQHTLDLNFISVRPASFTPWSDYLNGYGARLLYDRVHRDDVLDCVDLCVKYLLSQPHGAPTEGFAVNAVRANAYTDHDTSGWEKSPLALCESIFPGSRSIVQEFGLEIARRPSTVSHLGAGKIGYSPKRHFGTFLDELAVHLELHGKEYVKSLSCDY